MLFFKSGDTFEPKKTFVYKDQKDSSIITSMKEHFSRKTQAYTAATFICCVSCAIVAMDVVLQLTVYPLCYDHERPFLVFTSNIFAILDCDPGF
jgi:hypothetical protein